MVRVVRSTFLLRHEHRQVHRLRGRADQLPSPPGSIGRAGGGEGRVIQAATDGESYGHHTKFGDRSLAYALEVEAGNRNYWVTNYGAFLEKHPPYMEVEIKAGDEGKGTSWSCAHGVGRWYRDCGCQTGGPGRLESEMAGPLRRAFDCVRDMVNLYFEAEKGKLFKDPWAARNDYIQLILDPKASRGKFLERQAGRPLTAEEKVSALTHLEIQRNAMLMYTSCGWFFTEISGIETTQVMKYAARIFDFLSDLGLPSPEKPSSRSWPRPRAIFRSRNGSRCLPSVRPVLPGDSRGRGRPLGYFLFGQPSARQGPGGGLYI